MGAAAGGGCCPSCTTAQGKEKVATASNPISISPEKKAKGKASPSASPRKEKGREDSSGASPLNSNEGANVNSGGTGETPDKQEDTPCKSGKTGASGAGLAKKTKKGKEARKNRSSTLSLQKVEEEEEEPTPTPLAQPEAGMSLKDRVGRKSYLDFSNPSQTLIIFDWDDTLFPTTWIQEDMQVNVGGPCPKSKEVTVPLKQCATRAAELLKLAASMAEQVSIVTLAESPWVDYTVKKFYPSMQKVLTELNVRVIYARDFAPQADGGSSKGGAYNKQNFQSSEERAAYWTGVKGSAIRTECERFYSQYEQQTWKNVISLGDSDFEKEGTIEVTRQYVLSKKQQGAYQLPRTKTVKFLDSPTAEELCNEMRLVKHWMPTIVRKDDCFNLDFENVGDTSDDINELVKQARAFESEPRSEALFDNLFWKKDKNGDPFDESCWRPRRIWLSKTGRMWYESLKDVKAMELFDGASVGDLEVVKLEAKKDIVATIEGMPVYGMSFKKADAQQGDFFVLAQDEDREELMKHIKLFKKTNK
mmetsp:Transcript_70749/g.125941  ORF Transcript_70749/g.125941 Transcript_70749/m.125941 type:complete len:533 (+) Transcript_70749:146-1744(+)